MQKSNSTSAGIREVARLARVSPATVSRVLNGSEQVGAEYRRRVLDAVARTDYRPNRLARNLQGDPRVDRERAEGAREIAPGADWAGQDGEGECDGRVVDG